MSHSQSTEEHEVLGQIDLELFKSLLSKFKTQFSTPKIVKRLTFSFWDPEISKTVDTRIRITNGVPLVMQKVGEWEGKKSLKMEEISLGLDPEVTEIYTVYKLF